MKGYGRGEAANGSVSIAVEIRSSNSRFRDVQVRVPKGYLALEPSIRKEVTHNVSCGPFQIKTKKKGMNKTPRSYDFPFVVGRPTSSIPVAIAAPAPLPLPVALPHTPRHIQLSMQVDRLSSLLTQMIEESQQYNPAQLECLRTLHARLYLYYRTLSKLGPTLSTISTCD